MSNRWKDVLANGIEVAMSVALLYAMTPDAEMHAWRFTSRLCQRIAHRFGAWGLESERHYMSLAEKGRMI